MSTRFLRELLAQQLTTAAVTATELSTRGGVSPSESESLKLLAGNMMDTAKKWAVVRPESGKPTFVQTTLPL